MGDSPQQRQTASRASNPHPHKQRRSSQVSSAGPIPPPLETPIQQPSLQTQTTPQPHAQLSVSPVISQGHNAPKVAIPRLRKHAESTASSAKGGRHRVGHACEPCRTRKTKCSGERPVCKHCQDFKLACFYADGKRDKAKKQFGTMAEKVQDYESLLRELAARVGEQDAELIQKALEKDVSTDIESPSMADTTSQALDVPDSDGESQVSASVGSTGAVDRIEEDFNRNEAARATGFIGKNSEITWMQRLKQEVLIGSPPREAENEERGEQEFMEKTGGASPMFEPRKSGETPLQDQDEGFSATATSYHLDDLTVAVPESVDPYETPIKDIADNLFSAYLNTVHASFPIIGKATFISQYRKFVGGSQMKPGNKWLAILNLIFAIAARHSHLVQADYRGDDRDHLIYFTRARMLGVNGETFFNHADLQQIQISGLVAFYLLSTNQINRAWTFSGIAVRAAIGLGINMRNESTSTPDTSKEIRYRVWWALYSLEHTLSIMTGRPTAIIDSVCTTPLPVPLEEESFQTENAVQLLGSEMQKGHRFPSMSTARSPTTSTPSSSQSRRASKPSASPATPSSKFEWARNISPNQSLYFLHYVHLMQIAQEILNKLYTPTAPGGTWSDTQSTIESLNSDILNWRSNLPTAFDFGKIQRDVTFRRQRMSLGFCYYGTRITINRPCLCRLDRKIPHQSSNSADFNRNAAATCVTMAREMLDMIPDEPNPVALYKVAPWWCILHYLMQASSVLMLELSFRSHHMPEEAENILQSAKKVVRWLHAMSDENLAARRAWGMCDSLIRQVAPKIGRSVDDLPEDPPGIDQSSFAPMDFGGSMIHQGEFPSRAYHDQGQNQDFLPMLQDSFINPPVYASFDEHFPWNPTTGEMTSSMFPTSSDMDLVGEGAEDMEERN